MSAQKTTVVPSFNGGSGDDGDLYRTIYAACGFARRDYFAAAAFAGAPAGAADVFWKLYVPPNFLLKRSTRPAVSTNFCLPVKNGWHDEQMSTLIFGSVLRVSKVLPQAQCTEQV